MKNERIFLAARSAQERARNWRRWAAQHRGDYRAKCLAEANRAFRDARLWLRLARPVNVGGHHD